MTQAIKSQALIENCLYQKSANKQPLFWDSKDLTAYSLLKLINPTGMTEQKRTLRHLTSFKCAAQGLGWVRSRFGVENFMSGTHLQLKDRKTCFLYHHRGSQSLLYSHQFLNHGILITLLWKVWTQESFHKLSMIVWVNVVLNRTVVVDSAWLFDNLCGYHPQSHYEVYHIS